MKIKLRFIDEWIEACEMLLKPYKKNKEYSGFKCPLCVVDDSEKRDEKYCVHCLWEVFERKSCSDVEFPPKNRIPRLERWIKRLKEMKEEK